MGRPERAGWDQPASLGLKAKCRPHSDTTVLKPIQNEKWREGPNYVRDNFRKISS